MIVVPSGVELDVGRVKSFLERGGRLIVITPTSEFLQSLGIDYIIHYGDDGGISYIRLVEPILSGFSHYSIPVVGRRSLCFGEHYSNPNFKVNLPDDARVYGYMYELSSEVTGDRPVIWEHDVGRGKLIVLGYDLVECFRNLRQGSPEYVGWRPSTDDICRPAYLFGPDWVKSFRSQHLPIGDFHPMLILRLVEIALGMPMIRIWQLPADSDSAIIISGDEDGTAFENDEQICSFLDTIDANMVIYIQMQNTKTTREELRKLMDRGHRFSVHPYPVVAGESSLAPTGDLLGKIKKCVEDFKEKFKLPVRTVVNHRAVWTGYVDIPRLWESLGVEMDVNYSNLRFGRNFDGSYMSPPGRLPVKFLDENFKMINVYQHPRSIGDDVLFSPSEPKKSLRMTADIFEQWCESMVEFTLKPMGTVLGVCFHPANYVRFAGEAERRFLIKAKSLGVKLMSDYEWLDFWKLRESWSVKNVRKVDNGYIYRVSGKTSDGNVSISIPGEVSEVEVNGKVVEGRKVKHFGDERILVNLPEGVSEVEVKVKLSN